MAIARFLAAVLVAVSVTIAPVRAERPIVDLHRLDAYFALFAGDSSVPWKRTTVRLDTYSSAPVALSVYQVDPADVLTAGSNARPRAISTAHRHPVASFNFTPPGGYQFQSNVVDVPLGSREGFFVVEARRGDVGEQVWINRSRVGLLAKATPGSLLLWGVDLGTGMPLARMRVQFVVERYVRKRDDRWRRIAALEPLAASGLCARAVGKQLRLPEPIAAGAVSFGDRRSAHRIGGRSRRWYRARDRFCANASCAACCAPAPERHKFRIRSGARPIAESVGARSTAPARSVRRSHLPANAPAGDYAVLAQAAGGDRRSDRSRGRQRGDLSLQATADCGGSCEPNADVPLHVHASRGGVVVAVTVVRSPHVYVGDPPESTPWATTRWLEASVQTDAGGNAVVAIPHPNDDLPSTYGVHVEASGATADTRIVVPTARAAVMLTLDRDRTESRRTVGLLGRCGSPRRQSARRCDGNGAARARSLGRRSSG